MHILNFFCVLCSSAFAIKRSNSHCEFNFPLGVVAWSKFCKRKLKSSESSISSGRNRQNFAINTRVCFNNHTEMHFVLYRFKQYDMSYQWFNTSSVSSSMCSSALLFLARRLKCSTLRNKLFIQYIEEVQKSSLLPLSKESCLTIYQLKLSLKTLGMFYILEKRWNINYLNVTYYKCAQVFLLTECSVF